MQIDNPAQIPEISQKTGFSVFVFPRNFNYEDIEIKNSFILQPKEERNASGTIKIDDVKNVFSILGNKQTEDLTLLVKPAEKLNNEAGNAFLKNLEEPKDNIHIVFFTKDIQALLPTIRSRAFIYYLKDSFDFDKSPAASAKDLDLAKSLLAATPKQLITIADKLQKVKTDNRRNALDILDLCIELAYKTYFKTGDAKWLSKLEKLTATYQNVKQNGHIKLQIVANML